MKRTDYVPYIVVVLSGAALIITATAVLAVALSFLP